MNAINIITDKNTNIVPSPSQTSDKLTISGGLSIKQGNEVIDIINNSGFINSDLIDDSTGSNKFVTDEQAEALDKVIEITEDFDQYIKQNLLSYGNDSWLVNQTRLLLQDESHIFNNLPEDSQDGSELISGVKEFINLLIQDTTDSGFLYNQIKSYINGKQGSNPNYPNNINDFNSAKNEFINIINIFKYSVDCSYVTIQIKSSPDLLGLDRSINIREFQDLLLFVISGLVNQSIQIDYYNIKEIDGNA